MQKNQAYNAMHQYFELFPLHIFFEDSDTYNAKIEFLAFSEETVQSSNFPKFKLEECDSTSVGTKLKFCICVGWDNVVFTGDKG